MQFITIIKIIYKHKAKDKKLDENPFLKNVYDNVYMTIKGDHDLSI